MCKNIKKEAGTLAASATGVIQNGSQDYRGQIISGTSYQSLAYKLFSGQVSRDYSLCIQHKDKTKRNFFHGAVLALQLNA
ncbi:MAG: hypothetical protein ABW019_07680 [Chitinophagaceae bacterium]